MINVDAGTDYRRRTLTDAKLYHTPLGPAADADMSATFDQLAEARDEDPLLHIEHREIRARRRAGGVVWFDFKQLCGGPRSMNDYLELATQFHTLMLSDVPQMSPRLAAEARRFTWLVDVLYDRRVKRSSRPRCRPRTCTSTARWRTNSPHHLAPARDAVARVPGEAKQRRRRRPTGLT